MMLKVDDNEAQFVLGALALAEATYRAFAKEARTSKEATAPGPENHAVARLAAQWDRQADICQRIYARLDAMED